MERVGLRAFRAEVARYVRRAEAGERVVVTVGGRPAAQLGPVGASNDVTLADLAARGLVRLPSSAGREPADERIELWAGVRLDRLLSEVRGR